MLVVGVAVGRADAVVIAAPLVLVTLWSARRPDTEPQASAPLTALTVNEGEEVAWEATIEGLPTGGVATVVHPGQRLLEVEPAEGLLVAEGADGTGPGLGARRGSGCGRCAGVAGRSATRRWRRTTAGTPGAGARSRSRGCG